MASSCCKIITIYIFLVSSTLVPLVSASPTNINENNNKSNYTVLQSRKELLKLRRIRGYLRKLNKPSVKTIKSPDGDVIECVFSHHQPAFDHPKLKGQKPLDPPEWPKGHNLNSNNTSIDVNLMQAWSLGGESCPQGTIPIRRTTEEDILRASSIRKFGRKRAVSTRRDSTSSGHQHAVAYAMGNGFYGAKASLNIWSPTVTSSSEFSLSQLWVIAGSFGDDLNTIEAGWQVNPQLYGDNSPRFFTYWTTDAYQTTGCYNLLCSGFVQTNNKIAIGAGISPLSAYSGGQYDINLLVWKDPKHGHWWLQFGSGLLIGYWPSFLFSHLAGHASMVQFGGEIFDSQSYGSHTSTQMGSGHFAGEGFRKAAYFRNLETVDWDNNLLPLCNLQLLADNPDCYSIQGGYNSVWGNYFYYGGPGRNVRCP